MQISPLTSDAELFAKSSDKIPFLLSPPPPRCSTITTLRQTYLHSLCALCVSVYYFKCAPLSLCINYTPSRHQQYNYCLLGWCATQKKTIIRQILEERICILFSFAHKYCLLTDQMRKQLTYWKFTLFHRWPRAHHLGSFTCGLSSPRHICSIPVWTCR
jgi:hypothetical protein